MKPEVLMIIGSIREGRQTPRVAKYLQKYIEENELAQVDVADLKELNFPLFTERLSRLENPPENLVRFGERVKKADVVLWVLPEYNSGYPACIKNAFDALYDEWHYKPMGFATVSAGNFGGINCGVQMQTITLKVRAVPLPETLLNPRVQDNFDADGNPKDKSAADKRAASFVSDLIKYAEAFKT
jgi:NAD(P)H-dependent FMN reductase